jgi:hypothetical protein
MTTTSDRPYTVDGVRLDTLAWNITKINRSTAARRSGNQLLPGVDGLVPSLNDNLEPLTLGLEMFVMGTDADGAVPVAGKRDTMRANLDELTHLFGKRHALLDVQEKVSATDTRRMWAKVQDAIAPDVNLVGSSGLFTVGLFIPYGVAEDVATADWTGTAGAASGTTQEVTTLRGASERTTDTIVLVKGPVTNPRVTDPNTGAYVQLNQALSSTQFWRFNVATWATRYGTGLGLGSADTTGTDGTSTTVFGGTRNQAAFLPIVPIRSGGLRISQLALSGTAFTGATQLSARTRRKYAL